MRINAHSHIFNLRSVMTKETAQIFLDRLKAGKWPSLIRDPIKENLQKYLSYKIDDEELIKKITERLDLNRQLKKMMEGIELGSINIGIEINGLEGVIEEHLKEMVREYLLNLLNADEADEDFGNTDDILKFIAIAFLPSVEDVTDVIMKPLNNDEGIVALMMDITDGTDDDKLFEEQLRETSDAMLAYPGRIFSFVKVNTIRRNHYSLMQNAIERMGFWGVKIYPSLGYTPDSEEMMAVYKYCQKLRIPVMMHCNQGGFKRDNSLATKELANPGKWENILNEYPDLKICFGHFGGSENFITSQIPDESWTGAILRLMENPRYTSVYADIAYHEEALTGSNTIGMSKSEVRDNYFRNLKYLLNRSPFQDRILWGTDYFMIRQISSDQDYLESFQKNLTEIQFKRISETNPREYLGLPGSANPSTDLLDYHLNFFRSKKMKVQRVPAPWLNDAVKRRESPDNEFIVIPEKPSWERTPLNERLADLFGSLLSPADKSRNLSFENLGRVKLGRLQYYLEEGDNTIELGQRVRQLSTVLRRQITNSNASFCFKLRSAIKASEAEEKIGKALKNKKFRIYQLVDVFRGLFEPV